MKDAGKWTADRLKAFLLNPRNVVPGNRMAFAGLPKPEERDDVVAWLAKPR